MTLSTPGAADSLAPGAPADSMRIEDFVTDVDQLTAFAFLPDGRLLITRKSGELVLASADGQTTEVIANFDVDTDSEKGLLNVLVHPGFAQNHLIFLYYSRNGGDSLDKHRVVTVPFENDDVNPAAETVIVSNLRGPANHDGGALALSPDGRYLYVGVGDTGCNSGQPPEPAYTPTNYFGTCLTTANGKILRVNVDGSIPTDNPIVGDMATACGDGCGDEPTTLAMGRGEIFAWGFRNPWRIWADPQTGNVWVGDVGEVTFEEINVVPPAGGKHYGWPWREGRSGHPLSKCTEISPNVGDCVEPVYHCGRGGGADGGCSSITGGVIVDSCSWPPTLRGRYYFADFSAGVVYSLGVNAGRDGVNGPRANFANSTASAGPVHFDVGPDGNLYYGTHAGTIVRVSPRTPATCAGAGGSGGGGGASGGAANVSGSDADGGCGCRMPGSGSRALGWVGVGLLGLCGALLLRRGSRS